MNGRRGKSIYLISFKDLDWVFEILDSRDNIFSFQIFATFKSLISGVRLPMSATIRNQKDKSPVRISITEPNPRLAILERRK